MKIIIYHDYIPKVGGIESAVYNVAKGLDREGYEVVIAFRSAESPDSLFRYAECGDVINIEEDIKGDICLVASNHDIPSTIEVKRYLQWVHSDYDRYKLKLKNKDLYEKGKLEYIAVSNHSKKVIERREDIKATKVIYNLIDKDFGEYEGKPLRLVTASRVSPEKGFSRMLILAEKLKSEGVDFLWTVYGDNTHFPNEYQKWVRQFRDIEEVYFVGYKSDITPALREADYLVQLSDFEGCPLAVLEALKMEVPCIVTDWNGVEELIEDKVNGHILPMSMNIDKRHTDKIVNDIPEFKYKPLSTIKDWIKIIDKK